MAVLDGSHAAADTGDAVGAALGKIVWALPQNIGRPTATMRQQASAVPDRGAVRPARRLRALWLRLSQPSAAEYRLPQPVGQAMGGGR